MVAGDPRVPNREQRSRRSPDPRRSRWFHGARPVKVEDYKVLPPRYKLVYIPMKTIEMAEMDI